MEVITGSPTTGVGFWCRGLFPPDTDDVSDVPGVPPRDPSRRPPCTVVTETLRASVGRGGRRVVPLVRVVGARNRCGGGGWRRSCIRMWTGSEAHVLTAPVEVCRRLVFVTVLPRTRRRFSCPFVLRRDSSHPSRSTRGTDPVWRFVRLSLSGGRTLGWTCTFVVNQGSTLVCLLLSFS